MTPVVAGVCRPFSSAREVSWNYFCEFGNNQSLHFARKLSARNQDVLVFVTSISFSLLFVLYPILLSIQYGKFQQSQVAGRQSLSRR